MKVVVAGSSPVVHPRPRGQTVKTPPSQGGVPSSILGGVTMNKSLLGEEPKEGDLIAYGVRSGNGGSLHIGVIVDVTKRKVVPLVKDLLLAVQNSLRDENNHYIPAWRKGKKSVLNSQTKYVILDFYKDEEVGVLIEEIKSTLL